MEPTTVHATFVHEHSYSASPSRVFAAFADPEKKRRWFVSGDHHTTESHTLDFRPGGKEVAHIRFAEGTPVAGMACTNETTYQHIVPNRLIVFCSTMTLVDQPTSTSLVTVELLDGSMGGTDLTLTHQGTFYEGSDGPVRREQGWKTLFARLPAELGTDSHG